MKKIGTFRLALAFGGCFLGAGYVSGQEMWQFFGQYGKIGILGLLLAIVLLCIVGAVTLMLTRLLGRTETDILIIGSDYPALRWTVFGLEAAFLFCVCIIMAAGVGALCDEVFGIPVWLGCLTFTVIVTVISLFGFSGMVTAFSAIVPVLVVAAVAFGVRVLLRGELSPEITHEISTTNPLLRFWPLAAFLFMCYNVFGSIAILAPLGPFVRDDRTVTRGMIGGGILLLLVGLSVMICVNAAGTQDTELPMLTMALEISKPVGWIYGLLLLIAMFGTCLSCLVAFVRTICDNFHFAAKHSRAVYFICAVVIFFGSLFGFGDLIGVVYPLFGYCSSVFIVLLVIHYCRVKRKNTAS